MQKYLLMSTLFNFRGIEGKEENCAKTKTRRKILSGEKFETLASEFYYGIEHALCHRKILLRVFAYERMKL